MGVGEGSSRHYLVVAHGILGKVRLFFFSRLRLYYAHDRFERIPRCTETCGVVYP